jgi:SAM-dependent methyltransferase
MPAGVSERVSEVVHLQRMHRRRAPSRAVDLVEEMGWLRSHVRERFDVELDGLRMLDVGGGQLLPAALYFAQTNDVVSIDQAFVPRSSSPLDYVSMLWRNGPVRAAKTIGRKLLGVDREFRRSLQSELGLDALAEPTLQTMDAGDMDFSDAEFDVVYSFSVFEHLDDPTAVVREVARVLRPGGVAILHVHPFTSENGAHDPRHMSGDRADLPEWAHLRPEHRATVRSNAFLNEWRVDAWRALFEAELPGSTVELRGDDDEAARRSLAELRTDGELLEYGDDELLNPDLYCLWRRPQRPTPEPAAR